MNQNVPEGEKVYSIKGHYLDLYTLYRYKVGGIDYDSSPIDLYNSAVEKGYQWLLLEDMLTFYHHPELREIFDAKISPDWLELTYDVTEGGHRAKLYRILSRLNN